MGTADPTALLTCLLLKTVGANGISGGSQVDSPVMWRAYLHGRKINLAASRRGYYSEDVERETNDRKRKVARTKIMVLVLVAVALPLLWRFTPLREWINLATILTWQTSLRGHPAAPLLVIAIYLLGSLVFFPITMLTLATIFAFGPLWGNVYALAGWLLACAQGYLIGSLIGNDSLHRLTSKRFEGVLNRAERHGFLTVLGLRVVPVGPFSLINMIVGASAIRFRDFFLASVVGRIPGILTMTLFGVQLENALRQPALVSFALLGVVLLVLPWLLARPLQRFLRSRRRSLS